MTDFTIHIVSQRPLFQKTYSKLVNLLNINIICCAHTEKLETLVKLPASVNGAVIVDCGSMDADQIITCMLHWLSVQPEAAIVLIVDEQHDAVIDAGMDMGAMGVIIKASPPQVIIDSLQRILAGERCRPAPVVDVPRTDIPEQIRAQLSARQQKMLRAIMGGQSISATAQSLGMTPAKLVGEMRQVVATIRGREF
ncbi:MAG: hypothetical protein AB8B87_17940 [Granulosicoccus sp.]